MRRTISAGFLVLTAALGSFGRADDGPVPLAKGVRGLVTRSPGKVLMDGSLREWSEAYCTPVGYGHDRALERAAQFFYMWDDEAFYLGLRCLDTKQANPGPSSTIWNGDALEFYFDTRAGESLRGKDWTTGAVHLHMSAFEGAKIKPRWIVRPGIATSDTKLVGLEMAATQTAKSYELEIKLPWKSFPGFEPKPGVVIALDAELCYGDGGLRTDRTFSYGGPLSVQQPASLGKVQLVQAFDPEYFATAGPAAFPFWVDIPWNQAERGQFKAVVAVPPAFLDIVGAVDVRIHDTDGKIVKTIPAMVTEFGPPDLKFARAEVRWSIDEFAPGTFFTTARVSSRTEKTLTTVAPKMVSEGVISGR